MTEVYETPKVHETRRIVLPTRFAVEAMKETLDAIAEESGGEHVGAIEIVYSGNEGEVQLVFLKHTTGQFPGTPIYMQHFTFAGDNKTCGRYERAFPKIASQYLDEPAVDPAVMTFVESVRNAHEHGVHGDPKARIGVTLFGCADRLTYAVTHTGDGFDVARVVVPKLKIGIDDGVDGKLKRNGGYKIMTGLAQQVMVMNGGRDLFITIARLDPLPPDESTRPPLLRNRTRQSSIYDAHNRPYVIGPAS